MSEFGVDLTIESVARHARREAFREAVEALREMHYSESAQAAARMVAARFAPKEADPNGTCGRLMVGSGTDTYDPVCELPDGHRGSCKSSAAIDQHRIAPEGGRPAMREPTDEQVKAAAREAWRIGAERFGSSRWEDQSEKLRQQVLDDQRRILTAALSVEAPVDPA